MFKFKVEWIVALVLFSLCLLIFSGFGNKEKEDYSIGKAQYYMEVQNWDSAKIHAVHVLAAVEDKDAISMAQNIISIANDNISTEMEAKAEAKKMAYEALVREYDKEGRILWYRDASSPQYESAPAFYLYLGQRADELWMRMRIQYSGYDYLFINQVLIDTDQGGYAFTPKEKVQRNHGNKLVWEWMDESYSEDMYDMLYDMAHSEKVSIRFIGASAFEEREMSVEEKLALRRVLKAWDLSFDPLLAY